MKPRYNNAEEGFVDRTFVGPNGCILWRGAHGHGRPRMSVKGQLMLVSRYAWERVNGSIPEGMLVCHNCPGGDNPGCVNPEHMFLGTQKDNMSDASKKGRIKTPNLAGEACPAAKLSADDVQMIRFLAENAVTKKTIAEMFGAGLCTIYDITSGRSWKSVT